MSQYLICKNAAQVCISYKKFLHNFLFYFINFIALLVFAKLHPVNLLNCLLTLLHKIVKFFIFVAGSSSGASSKSATIEMYVGSTSYNENMSGAAETLSSFSEKSDTYFTADHHRHDLEVSSSLLSFVYILSLEFLHLFMIQLCHLILYQMLQYIYYISSLCDKIVLYLIIGAVIGYLIG